MQVSQVLYDRVAAAPESAFPVGIVEAYSGGGRRGATPYAAVSLAVLRTNGVAVADFIAAVFPIIVTGASPAQTITLPKLVLTVESKAAITEALVASPDPAVSVVPDPPLLVSSTAIDVKDGCMNDGAYAGDYFWATAHGILAAGAPLPADVSHLWLTCEGPATREMGTAVDAGYLSTAVVVCDPDRKGVNTAALDAAMKMALSCQVALGWTNSAAFTIGEQRDLVCAPLGPEVRRRMAHKALLLPNRPLLRIGNALKPLVDEPSPSSSGAAVAPVRPWYAKLVNRVHTRFDKPLAQPKTIPNATTHLVAGDYDYYHYCLDGFDDSGWGCAYRSLQSVLSWFQRNGYLDESFGMPDVTEIQKILSVVDPEKRKMPKFIGSKTWIGSVEVMLVLQRFMPQLDCQIQRLERGQQLVDDSALHRRLAAHFDGNGAPVMIGGAAYAHTIIGINCNVRTGEAQYLILDPHYPSDRTDLKTVQQKGWVGWKDPAKFFDLKQWYNLCIPMVSSVDWS